MKSANEMYEISSANHEKAMAGKLMYIQERIDEAANNGFFAVKFLNREYRLDHDVKEHLKQMGYEVQNFSDQREPEASSVTISWYKPTDTDSHSTQKYSNASQFTNYEQSRW